MLLLLVLRIISISKKVESISSTSALENPSATASANWGGCIKMLPHVHHALAAREARRTWHVQPPHKGRPLIKLHKVGEFPNHWKGLKFHMGKKKKERQCLQYYFYLLNCILNQQFHVKRSQQPGHIWVASPGVRSLQMMKVGTRPSQNLLFNEIETDILAFMLAQVNFPKLYPAHKINGFKLIGLIPNRIQYIKNYHNFK